VPESLRTAGGVVLLMAVIACAGVLFTAPAGSSCTLIPNPPFVAADGGVSLITTIVTEPAGTPVSNGTVILFFTDIGSIDAQGKTKDGIARVNFVADSRSGTAHITALCGGPAGSGGTGSTTTTLTTGTTLPVAPGGSGGSGTGTATVTVGNVRVVTVKIRANPPRITTSNSTHVFAAVYDAGGNPVPNVPVYFTVTDNIATEFFDATFPVYTNNNGEAENVLRTRRTTAGTAKVKASAPGNGAFVNSDELSIAIQ
jgi:hypothetical protein